MNTNYLELIEIYHALEMRNLECKKLNSSLEKIIKANE